MWQITSLQRQYSPKQENEKSDPIENEAQAINIPYYLHHSSR